MAGFTVDIHALNSGTALLSNAPVQGFRFNYVLNAPGAFEADLYLEHANVTQSNFAVGQREIRIKRDGTLVWGGYLWAATANPNTRKLRIRGEGYFSRLRRRILHNDLIKYDKDPAQIAWDLIDYTQSNDGTFGITDGKTLTSITVDRVYCATSFPTIGDSIQELTEMDDSLDFWITPTIGDSSNKVFKNATPRRGSSKAVTLDQDNIITLEHEFDASELANRVWGVGSGECNPPSFEATASASISTYGELHATADFDDLTSLPSVKAHTREEIRNLKTPREQARVRLQEADYTWGSFDVGDIITLSSDMGYLSGSKDMRVISIDLNLDPDNTIAFIDIFLDSVTT